MPFGDDNQQDHIHIGIAHHQQYHREERTIISKTWQFIPVGDLRPSSSSSSLSSLSSPFSQRRTYTLKAGEKRWNFELALPGDLPQSIETAGARVVYKLKAVVERPTFYHNLVKKHPIRIVRGMMPSSEFELSQSLEIRDTWADKMAYDISIPSRVYSQGEAIPVSFTVVPLAPDLRVRSLSVTLKETCTYSAKESQKKDTRVVRHEKHQNPFGEHINHDDTSYVLRLTIPDRSPLVFCDCDIDMIRVQHRLKFGITLENTEKQVSELRCAVPVTIIDSVAEQSEVNSLPAYDEAWRSVPYDPEVWELLRTRTPSISAGHQERRPVTITSRRRGLSIPSSSNQAEVSSSGTTAPRPLPDNNKQALWDDANSNNPGYQPRSVESSHGLWWHGMELSRVPSYRTALQQEPAPLSSSLPPYDSLSPRSPASPRSPQQ